MHDQSIVHVKNNNMKSINWNHAIMCADISSAVYNHGPGLEYTIRKYTDHKSEIREFDCLGAQGVAFKLTKDSAVVAFRGTEPDEWSDVIADIKTWPSESETQGSVHTGFKNELDKIYTNVLKWIRSRAVNKQTPIFVTGHSLGAAMATIFTSRLFQLGYNVQLYTFGSPRVGDKKWTEQFKDIPSYRFVNNNDIVTNLPPAGFYSHAGELYYMTYKGHIRNDLTFWQRFYDKTRSTLKAFSKFELFDSVYDHEILRYYKKLKQRI